MLRCAHQQKMWREKRSGWQAGTICHEQLHGQLILFRAARPLCLLGRTAGWLAGTPLSRVRRRGPQTSTHRTLDKMSFGPYNLNQPGDDSTVVQSLPKILSIQNLSKCTITINKTLAKVFLMDGSSAGWLCEMIRASWYHNIQSGKSREVMPPLQPFTYTRHTTLHNSDQRCQL